MSSKYYSFKNIERQDFVRPAVELIRFIQWLHDGNIDWSKVEEDDMWHSYLGAMTYIRERVGGGKSAPITPKIADLLTSLFKSDKTMEGLINAVPYTREVVQALVGEAGKNGFLYVYTTKRVIKDLETGKTRREEVRYYALTEYGNYYFLSEVVPDFGIKEEDLMTETEGGKK